MFLLKVFGTVTVILCFPAGLLASTKDLSNEYGDKCDRAWGDVVLGGIQCCVHVLICCRWLMQESTCWAT